MSKKTIKEDGTRLTSSEKNKRYRQKKKQKEKEQHEFLKSVLEGTEYDYILDWLEKNY